MPNWCESCLKVSSDNRNQLYDFVEKVRATRQGTEIDLQRLRPVPVELLNEPALPNGMSAVVNWKVDNWGTMSEFPVDSVSFGSGWIEYEYATKTAPAVAWIKYAARQYPDLTFQLYYYNPNDGYEGVFTVRGEDYRYDHTDMNEDDDSLFQNQRKPLF